MKAMSCCILLLGLAAAGLCTAHSELPTEGWCAHGQPVPVARFELFAEVLVAERDSGESCTTGDASAPANSKECGQFDDDYDRSRRKALAVCSAHAGRIDGDFGSVIAVVQSPETYLDPEHHRLYRLEHGLSGLCVRCQRPLLDPRKFQSR
jgi:FPC/CPF motif-containing protein YcgG